APAPDLLLLAMLRRFAFLLSAVVLAVSIARASSAQPTPRQGVGGIVGVVSAQSGAIRLGAVQITVHDARNQEVATLMSEGDGQFHLTALPEGKYTITASLEGFSTSKTVVVVPAGRAAEVTIDLALATVTQTVEVVAPMTVVSAADTLGAADAI